MEGVAPRTWPAARRQRWRRSRKELASEIDLRRVIQFFFFEQWHALRLYCAQRSIRIVGDIAIFVDHDSADVWSHRDLFRLKKDDFEPEAVAGVPPDAFSATGQRWGSPLYNWSVMKARGYDWWIDRLRWATQTCDYIRLDHFRGFEQFWEIPASDPTAVNGHWVDGPKDELFNTLRDALGGLPFFAEDLGYITPAVHALRERHQIPGMRGAAIRLWRSRRARLSAAPSHAGSGRFTPALMTMTPPWVGGSRVHRKRSAAPIRAYVGENDDGHSLGFHSPGTGVSRELVRGAAAGCAGIGQRGSSEYSQRVRGKLSLALPAGSVDRCSGRETGRTGHSNRQTAAACSATAKRRFRRLRKKPRPRGPGLQLVVARIKPESDRSR